MRRACKESVFSIKQVKKKTVLQGPVILTTDFKTFWTTGKNESINLAKDAIGS
jgi:hypothetical protein